MRVLNGRKLLLTLLTVVSAAAFATADPTHLAVDGFHFGMPLVEAQKRLDKGVHFVEYKGDFHRAKFTRKDAQGDAEVTLYADLDTKRIDAITRMVRFPAEQPTEQLKANLIRQYGPVQEEIDGERGLKVFCWGSCIAPGKASSKKASSDADSSPSLRVVVGGYGPEASNYAHYELRNDVDE